MGVEMRNGRIWSSLCIHSLQQRRGNTGHWLYGHMDTAPDLPGCNIHPRIIENYDGEDIVLNEEKNIIFSTEKFPRLKV